MRLFREVRSHDRMPNKDDLYFTSMGFLLYNKNQEKFYDPRTGKANPYAWYEPVKIPGNKDIDIESVKFAKRCDPKNETLEKQADLIFGYKEGFKAAINHLTGGKQS